MEKVKNYWLDFFQREDCADDWWDRKGKLWEKQNGKIIRIQGKGDCYRSFVHDNKKYEDYLLHLSFLIKQKGHFHLEEQVTAYRLEMENGEVIHHEEIRIEDTSGDKQPQMMKETEQMDRQDFNYNRREAVRYAERWWNSYNPDFRIFDDDCTNYISQCLLHGGAPMRGAPVRDRGWWYQSDNWSFSWSVAHSLRWYLSGSTQGLKGREVQNPEELLLGDVICYDFQGDGRWDHNTIVVNRDANGMPLVNAHTNNSRNRYWTYEDSAAWTPNIQYKFFRIGEQWYNGKVDYITNKNINNCL